MSLRIPLTVKRCPPTRPHDRIRYQHGDRCLTPEGIVLRRWQDRSTEPAAVKSGTRFDGCRLPPGTWRTLHACLALGLDPDAARDPEQLAAYMARVRAAHPTWRAPHPSKFAVLIQYLHVRGVLEKMLSAVRDDTSPGIPDLFVYRVQPARGVHDGRFVEVKRRVRRAGYKEPVPRGQRREHELLRSLGLRLYIAYLVE
jgi:hypothetical protein